MRTATVLASMLRRAETYTFGLAAWIMLVSVGHAQSEPTMSVVTVTWESEPITAAGYHEQVFSGSATFAFDISVIYRQEGFAAAGLEQLIVPVLDFQQSPRVIGDTILDRTDVLVRIVFDDSEFAGLEFGGTSDFSSVPPQDAFYDSSFSFLTFGEDAFQYSWSQLCVTWTSLAEVVQSTGGDPSEAVVCADASRTLAGQYVTELPRMLGDIDGNDRVDFPDFLILSHSFGEQGFPFDGDLDGDGIVEMSDFLILAQNYGSVRDGSVLAVPEPASLILLTTMLSCLKAARARQSQPVGRGVIAPAPVGRAICPK